MRTILILAAATLLLPASRAREWYEQLPPGINRAAVRALAPVPCSTRGDTDVCTLAQGHVEFTYRDEGLQQAILFDGPGGGRRTLYSTHGTMQPGDREARRAFLEAGSFAIVPSFSGEFVRTASYDGPCFPLDAGYLVVEPLAPLLGAQGFLADKAARVLVVQADGSERILYRAQDHWGELRPPELSADTIRQRVRDLRRLGADATGRAVIARLGPGDSVMGSGLDYRLYYLPDALLVVLHSNAPASGSIWVRRPGAGSLTFATWLQETSPGNDA